MVPNVGDGEKVIFERGCLDALVISGHIWRVQKLLHDYTCVVKANCSFYGMGVPMWHYRCRIALCRSVLSNMSFQDMNLSLSLLPLTLKVW